MVDQSERAFRLLVRELGVELCFTPMLSARQLVHEPGYSRLLDAGRNEDMLIAQIAGSADTVLLQGSGNSVTIGDMGDVRIEGNDNSFVSGAIGSLQIAGDRMRIDADGAIGDVTVNGNDNT